MNNKFYFPSIRSNVDSFYVMSLLSKASNLEKKGKEIFHFELGEPQISTPDPIIKEIKKLLKLKELATLIRLIVSPKELRPVPIRYFSLCLLNDNLFSKFIFYCYCIIYLSCFKKLLKIFFFINICTCCFCLPNSENK